LLGLLGAVATTDDDQRECPAGAAEADTKITGMMLPVYSQ
jgi:hypothetical protein